MMTEIVTTEKDLTPLQYKALDSLLQGVSKEEVARLVECSPRSIHRWLKTPNFKAKFNEGKRIAFEEATNKLTIGSSRAVDKLFTLIDNPETPPQVVCRACEIVLTNSVKLSEISELNDRIDRLEVYVNVQT
jgi:hypothetical protein